MIMASKWSQDIYINAYRFAAEAHWNSKKKQVVPGTDIPYLMHFSLVAMEVIAALEKESGLDENLAVQCALLHDTIEDTEITYDQLVEKFGLAVANGVNALTKDESIGANISKEKKKKLQMTDSLERIRKQPKEIWMVKMADRIPPTFHFCPSFDINFDPFYILSKASTQVKTAIPLRMYYI
jgi:(p)ppGpp synthase/HD superfamily hydrolase